MFTAGHGVEDILRREAAGWTFRKTRISEQFKFDHARSILPDEADMLLVLRKDGLIRFFTHAARPMPQNGDIVVSYGPSRHGDPDANQVFETGEVIA